MSTGLRRTGPCDYRHRSSVPLPRRFASEYADAEHEWVQAKLARVMLADEPSVPCEQPLSSSSAAHISPIIDDISSLAEQARHGSLCRWGCITCGFHNSLLVRICTLCARPRNAGTGSTVECLCSDLKWRGRRVPTATPSCDGCASSAAIIPPASRAAMPPAMQVPRAAVSATSLSGSALSGTGQVHERISRLTSKSLPFLLRSERADTALAILQAAMRQALDNPSTSTTLAPADAELILSIAGDAELLADCGFVRCKCSAASSAKEVAGRESAGVAMGGNAVSNGDDSGSAAGFGSSWDGCTGVCVYQLPPAQSTADVALLRAIGTLLARARPTATEMALGKQPLLRVPLMHQNPAVPVAADGEPER